MKNETSKSIIVLLILAFSQVGMTQPNIVEAQATNQQQAGARVFNPNQQLLDDLKNILQQQARLGQNPSNNPVLAGIQDVINRNSGIGTPTTNRDPEIRIVNMGPGRLRVEDLAGDRFIDPGDVGSVFVGERSLINLVAEGSHAKIEIMNPMSGWAKFWDEDEQERFDLKGGSSALPRSHIFTLTRNFRGYRLEGIEISNQPPMGNPPNPPGPPLPGFIYEITVNTDTGVNPDINKLLMGDGPGTDSNVFIEIDGNHGTFQTGPISGLPNGHIAGRDHFESGGWDRLTFPGSDIGQMTKITVWRDDSDFATADWQLHSINVVKKTQTGRVLESRTARVGDWLTVPLIKMSYPLK